MAFTPAWLVTIEVIAIGALVPSPKPTFPNSTELGAVLIVTGTLAIICACVVEKAFPFPFEE